MAFGLFRMMFSAGGNAVPVLEQMNSASQKLLQTSSGLSTNLRQAGASMTTLVSATSNLSQFHAFEQSIAKVNSQASFLQSTLLDMAGTIKRLGIESLGVSEQMLSLYTIEELLSDENEMLTASAKATAQAATASGYKACATAPNSSAFGYMSQATGLSSTAVGFMSYACGTCSTVSGYKSCATVANSSAFGYKSCTSGL